MSLLLRRLLLESLDQEGEDALDRDLVNVFNVVRVSVFQRLPDRVQERLLDRLRDVDDSRSFSS